MHYYEFLIIFIDSFLNSLVIETPWHIQSTLRNPATEVKLDFSRKNLVTGNISLLLTLTFMA